MIDLSFWSLIAVALVLYRIGEVSKRLVLGRSKNELAEAIKTPWKKHFYDTQMVHPVVLGGLIGLLLGGTVPEIVAGAGVIGSVLYFAGAGVLSTYIYDLVKRAIRKFNPEIKLDE